MHSRSCPAAATTGAVLLLPVLLVVLCSSFAEATDSGTFFLKATKNVPRIGRRSETGDSSFLKATKNIPRIGRRGRPWAAGLREMQSGGAVPWFRYPESTIPSRIVRTGPASLTAAWEASGYPLYAPRMTPSTSQHSQPERAAVWKSTSAEQDNDLDNPYLHYDVEEDEELDLSAAQLLAPPPLANFPRLPQEGSLSRQTPSRPTNNYAEELYNS